MLARVTPRIALTALAAVLLTAAGQSAALAGGGPGGSPFGSVVCGQSYAPSCSVSAGSPGSRGTAGTGQAGAARPLGNSGGGAASAGCSGAVINPFGCVPPGGCSFVRGNLTCPPGIPAAARKGGPPAPVVLAMTARQYLLLPGPQIRSNPVPTSLQLTRLPTWLWISRGVWAARSRTASVPGESVTATATPVSVTWYPGDGSTVVCKGPGTPYSSAYNPSSPSPDCGHTYTASSAGQPQGRYTATATIEWAITWHATSGAGGTLPPLYTTATAQFEVAESQAVDTSGGM